MIPDESSRSIHEKGALLKVRGRLLLLLLSVSRGHSKYFMKDILDNLGIMPRNGVVLIQKTVSVFIGGTKAPPANKAEPP